MEDTPKTDLFGQPQTTWEGRPIYTETVNGDYIRNGWGQKESVDD
jgi:hypothetical protein